MSNRTRNVYIALLITVLLVACAAASNAPVTMPTPANGEPPASEAVTADSAPELGAANQWNTELAPSAIIKGTSGSVVYGVYEYRANNGLNCVLVANIYEGGINTTNDTASLQCK